MNKLLLTFCLLSTTTVARADLEARGTETQDPGANLLDRNSPKTKWVYDSLRAIYRAPTVEAYGLDYRRFKFEQQEVTRYEVAVAVARITDSDNDHVSMWDATSKSLELVDAMAALQIEFAYELKRLGVRPGAIEYSNLRALSKLRAL